jgi:hypothetical protein
MNMIKNVFDRAFSPWGIELPENKLKYRSSGFIEKSWEIQYCFGKEDGKEYLDCYCRHRMTNDRHIRIYEDGTTNENLPTLDYYDYDPEVPDDKQKKGNEILKLLREKGFFPFPSYGHVYEGDFVDGELHGKGKYIFASGYSYDGELDNWIQNGKGKKTSSSGDLYEGDFAGGYPDGKGKYTYSNGNVYEGDFGNGKPRGKGKYTFADGSVYEGGWAKGKQHGNGKKTYTDGKVEEGNWNDGEFVG